MNKRYFGKVTSYSKDKGYGYAEYSDFGNTGLAFLHFSEVDKAGITDLKEDDVISFEVHAYKQTQAPVATEIRLSAANPHLSAEYLKEHQILVDDPYAHVAQAVFKKCSCQINDLLNFGCKCGGS